MTLLAGLALGLRVWLVVAVSADHGPRPLGYEHGRIAENLLAGKGFTIEFLGVEGPTSQQAPFYPLLLAAVYSCLGVGTPASILAVQLLQCLAGTALVLAIVWMTWSLLPELPTAGWMAGLGAAVYPTHVYMATHLQVAPWAALVLTLLVGVIAAPRWRASWQGASLAGLLAGTLLLIEPILAIALPVCALGYGWFEGRGHRFRWTTLGHLTAMSGVALLVVSPWLVRNWAVHGEFVFIKSTFGYAFWQGNHPISWGTDKIPKPGTDAIVANHDGTLRDMDMALWEARHKTLYIDDVVLKPNGYREFAGLSEPERSRVLGRQAWQFLRDDPARYARLCLQRLRYFLVFDETNPKTSAWAYRAGTSAWLVLTFVGLLTSWPHRGRLWPLYAIFLLVTLFHSLVITSVRFRIPIEPLTFAWASIALAPTIQRVLGAILGQAGQPQRDASPTQHEGEELPVILRPALEPQPPHGDNHGDRTAGGEDYRRRAA